MYLKLSLAALGERASKLETRAVDLRRRSEVIHKSTFITAGAITGLVVLVIAFFALRRFRANHPEPKYIPTPFLKRLWTRWNVPGHKGHYQRSGEEEMAEATANVAQQRAANSSGEGTTTLGRSGSSNVQRNTSVRSVMTLPAYNPRASHEERVIGREGERDGIDIVVEMPTAEDHENMRESEMDAMFQIRQARRRQMAERQERRDRRREARARNDAATLEEIRAQIRNAGTSDTREIEELRAEHNRLRGTRERSVSSVSYAELGVARHDGTRLRANSTESERVGLLTDAASIAASNTERRNSGLSIYSTHSSRAGSPSPSLGLGLVRSRSNSGPNSPRLSISTERRASLVGSSPELIDSAEADLGNSDLPPHSPPGYDEVSLDDVTPVHSRATSPYPEPPPEYPGPAAARNERLSAHVEDIIAGRSSDESDDGSSSRRTSVFPQLPSLELNGVPQIVIEPSSAYPRD